MSKYRPRHLVLPPTAHAARLPCLAIVSLDENLWLTKIITGNITFHLAVKTMGGTACTLWIPLMASLQLTDEAETSTAELGCVFVLVASNYSFVAVF